GPHDGRPRRVPSRRRNDRGGSPTLLRDSVPGGGGRRHLLRSTPFRAVEALGGEDTSGLRLRRQGARADDRAAERGEALTQGTSGGAARNPEGEGPDLREGPPRRAQGSALGDVRRRVAATQGGWKAHGRLLAVPALGLSVKRGTGPDPGRQGAPGRHPSHRGVPAWVLVQREERRPHSAFPD